MKTEGYKTIETGGYNEISRGGEHQKVETNGLGHIYANNIKYSHMTINSCGSSTKEYINRKKNREIKHRRLTKSRPSGRAPKNKERANNDTIYEIYIL